MTAQKLALLRAAERERVAKKMDEFAFSLKTQAALAESPIFHTHYQSQGEAFRDAALFIRGLGDE